VSPEHIKELKRVLDCFWVAGLGVPGALRELKLK
jgi:hypothetical protein